MENSKLNLIFPITLSISLMIGIFSCNNSTPKLAKFQILIETTNDGVTLNCQEGCA